MRRDRDIKERIGGVGAVIHGNGDGHRPAILVERGSCLDGPVAATQFDQGQVSIGNQCLVAAGLVKFHSN